MVSGVGHKERTMTSNMDEIAKACLGFVLFFVMLYLGTKICTYAFYSAQLRFRQNNKEIRENGNESKGS